ncbi:TPA: AraC family transcriptional regulator [bacterium]|jgi:AraC-like DNA-binding protein|nr:AraC family transcriptional regulator [bacterium]
MSKIDIVRNMQIFIEEHIEHKITLVDLANNFHYSPWHISRLFQEVLNITPGDYIRKLKLSKSAMKLRDEKVKIIDIASEYGYESVDGYQRAFLKEFGVNPYEYSRNNKPINLFIPFIKYDKKEKHHMKETNYVFISVVEKEERKVIIKRGIKANNYMDYCEEVGCDIWGILTSIKSPLGEPVCLWLPKKYVKEGTSIYVQGVEVPLDYQGEIPEGFDVITLPKSTYLKFIGEPFLEENYGEAIKTLWEAIDKFNPQSLGYRWDDKNPRIQLEPIGKRGYIELVPVKI